MIINNETKKWRFDFPIIGMVIILCAVGLLNLYSASSGAGEAEQFYFFSHLKKLAIAFFVMFAMLLFHYRLLKSLAFPLYLMTIILLIGVLFWGVERGGQKNWLNLGFTLIQPGEFAKLSTILMLAYYFDRFPLGKQQEFQELIKPLVILLLPVFLLMLEGDLGNTVFFFCIGLGMFWVSGLKKKYFLILLSAILLFSPLAYKWLLSTHQKQRIHTFLHPEDDPRGKGYHLLQSKIAVGSGKVWGKGYQEGYFSRLKYVPERYTDFVFAVFAEEWGLVGTTFLLFTFGVFLFLLIRNLSQYRDPFAVWFIVGVTSWLFSQIAFNIGGVLGLLPLAGVTLPFFSYGGSSLFTIFIALGWILNMQMRRYVF